MRAARTELIDCHDCGKVLSFSAATCPHCGSIEPRGPYVHSHRERRLHRIEERNDRNLMVAVLACGVAGAFYGAMTASGTVRAVLLGLGYGCLGALLGIPVAFVINMTRHIGR